MFGIIVRMAHATLAIAEVITPDPTLRFRNFLTPRYWLTWLGLGFLRAAMLLPYRTQVSLGAGLGMLIYHLMPWRRSVAQINIALCFPNHTTAQQHALVKSNFRSAGISLLETALSWWGTRAQIEPLMHIEGLEHLHHALQHQRGVILLSAHFTCLEIGGRLLALQQPFHVMYKKHRNLLFEAVMKQAREHNYELAIERHDVRSMLRSLKQGNAVWYAPDQDFGAQHSVFAPFMGVTCATLTATARLSKMSGAPVVPFFPQRLDDGSGYRLILLPALENFPSGNDVADATRINSVIEHAVRRAPEQYLWLHRRFKTRPPGEAALYPARRKN